MGRSPCRQHFEARNSAIQVNRNVEKGVSSALNELKNKAAQLGANRLVIQKVASGNIYTEMTGDAYLCDDQGS